MKFTKKIIFCLISLALILSITDWSKMSKASAEIEEVQIDENFTELEAALSAIENLPNDVIEEAKEENDTDIVIEYLQEYTEGYLDEETEISFVKGENNTLVVSAGVVGCSVAIVEGIVSLALPISKLTKLKRIISDLGGAVSAASKLKSAYTTARQAGKTKKVAVKTAVKKVSNKLGTNAVDLLLTLTGVGNVYSSCFE